MLSECILSFYDPYFYLSTLTMHQVERNADVSVSKTSVNVIVTVA